MILCLLVKDFSARLFMAIFELPFRAPLRFVIELFESIVLLRTALSVSLCLSLLALNLDPPRAWRRTEGFLFALSFVSLRLPRVSPQSFVVISISISIFHRLPVSVRPSVRLSVQLDFRVFLVLAPLAPLPHCYMREREREERALQTGRQAWRELGRKRL